MSARPDFYRSGGSAATISKPLNTMGGLMALAEVSVVDENGSSGDDAGSVAGTAPADLIDEAIYGLDADLVKPQTQPTHTHTTATLPEPTAATPMQQDIDLPASPPPPRPPRNPTMDAAIALSLSIDAATAATGASYEKVQPQLPTAVEPATAATVLEEAEAEAEEEEEEEEEDLYGEARTFVGSTTGASGNSSVPTSTGAAVEEEDLYGETKASKTVYSKGSSATIHVIDDGTCEHLSAVQEGVDKSLWFKRVFI